MPKFLGTFSILFILTIVVAGFSTSQNASFFESVSFAPGFIAGFMGLYKIVDNLSGRRFCYGMFLSVLYPLAVLISAHSAGAQFGYYNLLMGGGILSLIGYICGAFFFALSPFPM
jgi:hypothetical protein